MNRGSARDRCKPSSTRVSFNEAPIHESGKSVPRADRQLAVGAFNEAPIHESGKFGVQRWPKRRYCLLQ